MKEQYLPAAPCDQRDKFQALNDFVTSGHGWIVSLPSDREVRLECLPVSTLPDQLRAAGYDVREAGEGERILPAAIVQRFVIHADGELELLTAGSTQPVARTVTHAGISKVDRYTFMLPDVSDDHQTIR